MPPSLTYPGVYVYEIPSGVRTIMGVSTSVTAFVGTAKRGKIDEAVHILSISDYERIFGGLSSDSLMSYAVRQFFLNGGSDAWVVRLAKNAREATVTLDDKDDHNVLTINALDKGKAGNSIEVRVDYDTINPASTFNLILKFTPPDKPEDTITESYKNLSMNSQDPRYVVEMIKDTSKLVKLERVVEDAVLGSLGKGTSTSGKLADSDGNLRDVSKLYDANHNQLKVSVNGLPPIAITLTIADIDGADNQAKLAKLCAAIQKRVRDAANSSDELEQFICTPGTAPNDKIIVMTSGVPGEASSVRVLPGDRNDISAKLRLGGENGGIEADAVAAIRPVEVPLQAVLTSGAISNPDLVNINSSLSAAHDSFLIGLDGYGPDPISLGTSPLNGIDSAEGTVTSESLALIDLADRITKAVQEKRSSNGAYSGFSATADTTNSKLVFKSGTRGKDSSVVVNPVEGNPDAGNLHLLADATLTSASNLVLQNGDESPFKIEDSEAYNLFIADRSKRNGIYALEEVGIFNILCLPGVTDPGILQDAASYCQERRAFLIVDSDKGAKEPEDMLESWKKLPKSNYAAVYYPWIKIADPLKNGKPALFPPSGTIAGLYARIDSSRGVWKAPAGTEATLVGAQAVEKTLTDLQNGVLNQEGINCIRFFPATGIVSWGARTLRGDDDLTDEYKYIPVRRLALYIEESLYRGTQWVVFEPNDEPLWAQIRLNLGAFMHGLFRQGAFQGKTPQEAYFVKCDKETTTQDDINRGIVNIVVGFAPLKPAEFVVIKIQQMAGQIQT